MHARRLGPQLGKLFKESAVEVKTFELRYFVRLLVPFIQMKNREGRVRPNVGYNGFPAGITLARVQFTLIAEGESAFQAVFWAELRRGYATFRVIRLIALIDFKGL